MKKTIITITILLVFLFSTILSPKLLNKVPTVEKKAKTSSEESALQKPKKVKPKAPSNKTPPQPSTKKENEISPQETDIADKIPVLLYHHLLPKEDIKKYNWSNNKIALPLETFYQQMKYLHDNNFYTATLDELNNFIDKKTNLPKKTVVITFDDGFLSNIVYAYPIMKKYNLKGTIFVIGCAAVEPQRNFDPKTVQYININEMPKYEDIFNFENHTYSLHKYNANKKPLILVSNKKTIIEDISKNKKLLNTKYFAYPFGTYNNMIIQCLKETGHTMAFTVNPKYVIKGLNKYELPRFEITPNTSMEEFIKTIEH